MKINGTNCSQLVKPQPLKTITIEFETEEELAEFYSLFNFAPVTRGLQHIDACLVRDMLGDVSYERAFNHIQAKCNEWYEKS